jgi:hypothetical protein
LENSFAASVTMNAAWHLAQINIGRIRAPMGDPIMADFKSALAEVNALAEAAPGFVWRLKDNSGDATSIKAFPDPMLLVNMSVWTDVLALQNYVYRTLHARFFARRQEWFERYEGAHVALWWIRADVKPTLEEAKERLALIERIGPSKDAFTFRKMFPAPAPDELPLGTP